MVKYGLVGAGYFGADLARALNQQEDAKVTVVYDPDNGAKIAEELGCDEAAGLDELVEREDISCVVVATPNYLHKEPVIKAAQHGKNVFRAEWQYSTFPITPSLISSLAWCTPLKKFMICPAMNMTWFSSHAFTMASQSS